MSPPPLKILSLYHCNPVKKFRASSTIINSEIHCLHGLEELVSNEIPPLYVKLHRLDT